MSEFKLYKWEWLQNSNPGYVVFRDCPDRPVDRKTYANVHRVANFISEEEARNYCDYRNYMTKKYGDDDVTKIVDYK